MSGFTTILFFLNRFMATSDSNSNILIHPKTAVANAERVLSSANLKRDARATKKKRSFIDSLKRIGSK